MASSEDDPNILRNAKSLRDFQSNDQPVHIYVKSDENLNTSVHYTGSVKQVVTDTEDPYIVVAIDTLTIDYAYQQRTYARKLFVAMVEAQNAVMQSDEESYEYRDANMAMIGMIEDELGITEEDKETIEIYGASQQIALTGIIIAIGKRRSW